MTRLKKGLVPRLPKASEDYLQMAVAEYLDMALAPGFRWFHPPNGGSRNVIEAVKLKRMGVKRGVPDIWIIGPCRFHDYVPMVFVIELKIGRNKPTGEQKEWAEFIVNLGGLSAMCRSLDEVIEQCNEWGVTR